VRLGGCPRPVTLTFDLLTLKSVWESHVTWGTPVQSFVFLGLLVFELEPMYATSDRQTGRGHNKRLDVLYCWNLELTTDRPKHRAASLRQQSYLFSSTWVSQMYTVSRKKVPLIFCCCNFYKVIGVKISCHTFVMLLPYHVKVSDTK